MNYTTESVKEMKTRLHEIQMETLKHRDIWGLKEIDIKRIIRAVETICTILDILGYEEKSGFTDEELAEYYRLMDAEIEKSSEKEA